MGPRTQVTWIHAHNQATANLDLSLGPHLLTWINLNPDMDK